MVGNTEQTHGEYPEPGDILSDRYRIVRELGAGGMGRVFLVEHAIIGKRAAVKVLAPELARDARLSARFLQEARIASQIRHENVVDINDFGTTPHGLAFFVMEYLEGTDLDRLVRAQGCLPWPRARGIIRQVCAALKAAHDLGVVHRDIKPENVFVSSSPEDRVTVLDFGIAKVAASPMSGGDVPTPAVTREGSVVGTPAYMSPEQAQGLSVDPRTDVYATGALLFFLLTGRTPFLASTDLLMLNRHLTEAPQLPSMVRPDAKIPEAADLLVMRALAKNPEKRWANMGVFLAALESIERGHSERTLGRSTDKMKSRRSENQQTEVPSAKGAAKSNSSASGKTRSLMVVMAFVAVVVLSSALIARRPAAVTTPETDRLPRSLAAGALDAAAPMHHDGSAPDVNTQGEHRLHDAQVTQTASPNKPKNAAPGGKPVLPKREMRRSPRPVFEPLAEPESQ